ncbi:MAG: hydrogen gas-evolving membrane-bound hydrogenase subunit E [Planctomycetota bacterium]|nr:hydrogen gas-evolving membrane-bound hydrogenase subunit E [Planctomycetota bacterium]
MSVELLIIALIVFMLLASLIAVETRDLLGSVIAVGAAGFALSVIDLLLGAPDLAFPQVLVEVITLILLIRMIMTRRDTSRQTPRDTLRTAAVLLSGGILLVVVFFAVGGFGGEQPAAGTMPQFGQPVMTHGADDAVPPGVAAEYLANAAGETKSANSVMSILLDYRAYDTLGEATVIFVAILGGYVVLRSVGRKKKDEVNCP